VPDLRTSVYTHPGVSNSPPAGAVPPGLPWPDRIGKRIALSRQVGSQGSHPARAGATRLALHAVGASLVPGARTPRSPPAWPGNPWCIDYWQETLCDF